MLVPNSRNFWSAPLSIPGQKHRGPEDENNVWSFHWIGFHFIVVIDDNYAGEAPEICHYDVVATPYTPGSASDVIISWWIYQFFIDLSVFVIHGAGFPGLETGLTRPPCGPLSWGSNSWPMGLKRASSGCPLRTSWSKYGHMPLKLRPSTVL